MSKNELDQKSLNEEEVEEVEEVEEEEVEEQDDVQDDFQEEDDQDDQDDQDEDDEDDKVIKSLKVQKAKAKEKAEQYRKELEELKASQTKSDLSQSDLYTIIKNDVDEKDVETVVKFAKFEGVSISEALNNDVLQGVLKKRAETRKTAQATSTGGGRRSNTKATPEQLLAKAQKGELPENDNDIATLIDARFAKRN